jgi:hypothetical protein
MLTLLQNAVNALEKRIVSRIGQQCVKCIDDRLSVEDCWNMVREMVEEAVKDYDNKIQKAFKVPFDRNMNLL